MGGWGVGAVWGGVGVGDYWGGREVVGLLCIVHWMDCYLTGVYVLVRWFFIVLLIDLNCAAGICWLAGIKVTLE
jgi:hypothetical protein